MQQAGVRCSIFLLNSTTDDGGKKEETIISNHVMP
jgi:hypothetical protein